MNLWFRRPAGSEPPATTPDAALAGDELIDHPLRAYTESLYLTGTVRGEGRLSDLLNRRQPLVLWDAAVVPLGAPRTALSRQTWLVVDPMELDLVLGGPLDRRLALRRSARRIFKVRYPVLIEGATFTVRGTIHLFPGTTPEFEAYQTGTLFLPVTEAVAWRDRRLITDPGVDVVLVNRHTIQRIRQLDAAPGH